MNFNFTSDSSIVVQTDPTITFENGMTLWLGKKGETVQITQYDWDCLNAMAPYVNQLGRFHSGHVETHIIKPRIIKAKAKTHNKWLDFKTKLINTFKKSSKVKFQ